MRAPPFVIRLILPNDRREFLGSSGRRAFRLRGSHMFDAPHHEPLHASSYDNAFQRRRSASTRISLYLKRQKSQLRRCEDRRGACYQSSLIFVPAW
jgi:hypothetical protein